MIPEEAISEIRERIDIVAFIGEYVALKRRGANWVGICPFHAEKTPSFHVHKARQFYHCFGCRESGDVVSFLMKLEGRSFPDAVRALAERAGIELPETRPAQDTASKREKAHRDRLFALMETAAEFYHEQLWEHPDARSAHELLRRRAVNRQTASVFRLGYAPDRWDTLAQFLQTKGCSFTESEQVGLLVPRRDRSGWYDRFRNRLLFPVFDIHGRVVAFSGRTLGPGSGDNRDPKYLNSPDSPLYSKGALLFGLHQARVEIRRKGWVAICEGNFDLLALYQAGITNAVAPLGTAFTEAQARLLRRFTDRAVLVFDSDLAGHKAVQTSYPLLAGAGISARVADLPPGHDPDSYLRDRGAEALQRLIDGAPGIVEFLIDQAAGNAKGSAAESAAAIQHLGPIIAVAESPVERHKYIEHVAKRFEIHDLEAVKKELRRGLREHKSGLRGAGGGTGSKNAAPGPVEPVDLPKLQCEVLGALLDCPELFQELQVESFAELLTNRQLRSIFQKAAVLVRSNGEFNAHELLSSLESELAKSLALEWLKKRLAVPEYESAEIAKSVLESGIRHLGKEKIERELKSLARKISNARRDGDEKLASALSKQQVELTRTARNFVSGLKR